MIFTSGPAAMTEKGVITVPIIKIVSNIVISFFMLFFSFFYSVISVQ